MDLDLEIISEEGDCPDPLFDSIMNAMNSMKEATADKIYQKIQKEGETNYSKPQVDRALASALKYGIFEVKNNRYRVRDDVLDDEDTVYWKLQKKREQTPFRIQDELHDKPGGPKLDPERDNQRFAKIVTSEQLQCPQCGRVKRPLNEDGKGKAKKKLRNMKSPKRKRKPHKRANKMTRNKTESSEDHSVSKKKEIKRKPRSDSVSDERRPKMRRTHAPKTHKASIMCDPKYEMFKKVIEEKKLEEAMSLEKGKFGSSDSEADTTSTPSEDDESFDSKKEPDPMRFRKYEKPETNASEREDEDVPQKKCSSASLGKMGSDSEQSDFSSGSGYRTRTFDNLPGTSRNQYLSGHEDVYEKQYARGQGCSDEPQGAIIQTNNVLTIEPMDSLAFKSPEQASYIS